MWKYVLNKMIKQKEATFFIVMIILSFAVSSAAPYLNGKFIDLLTVSKDIHLIVQFALIIVGVGVVGALLSYCSNLTTVKVLTKTTIVNHFFKHFSITRIFNLSCSPVSYTHLDVYKRQSSRSIAIW